MVRGDSMAYKNKSDAFKNNNKFIKNNYDRINLTVPKGHKELIQEAAKVKGLSVNGWINSLIDNALSGGGFHFDREENFPENE